MALNDGGRGVRVALVAGGGAVKAYAFHVGVLQGLAGDGFCFRSGLRWQPQVAPRGRREINIYVGSSAGACVAASLASGRPLRDLRDAVCGGSRGVPSFGYRVLFVPVAPNPARYLGRLAARARHGLLRAHHLLDIDGPMTTAGVEKYFRRHALPTNRFGDLAAELYIAATQVNGSRKVVFGPRDSLTAEGYDHECAFYDNVPISQAIAAAVAVPPLFAPYPITSPASGKRFHYYDGEVRDTLSLHVARDVGAEFAIASSIWHPYAYDDRVGTLADLGITAIAEQALQQAIEQKVTRDRQQAERCDELLALIDAHAAEQGLSAEAAAALRGRVCDVLHHRPVRTLHVVPQRADSEFFFEGSFFRFNTALIERSIAAGQRAYRAAIAADPAFLPALDRALST
jgi:predicted acylesterase/phospholipase RssA